MIPFGTDNPISYNNLTYPQKIPLDYHRMFHNPFMRQRQSEEQEVPEPVRLQVSEVLSLLNQNGMEYEEVLVQQQPPRYEFLFPKSKYYRYYTHQLFERGPNAQRKTIPVSKVEEISYEGSAESIQVGAMAQIIKSELAQVCRLKYRLKQDDLGASWVYISRKRNLPAQGASRSRGPTPQNKSQPSSREVSLACREKEGKQTAKRCQRGHFAWIQIKNVGNLLRSDEWKRELGTNSDGSMGAYGGKKYQGLGMRDEFSIFRREKSQNYYSNLQGKQKQ